MPDTLLVGRYYCGKKLPRCNLCSFPVGNEEHLCQSGNHSKNETSSISNNIQQTKGDAYRILELDKYGRARNSNKRSDNREKSNGNILMGNEKVGYRIGKKSTSQIIRKALLEQDAKCDTNVILKLDKRQRRICDLDDDQDSLIRFLGGLPSSFQSAVSLSCAFNTLTSEKEKSGIPAEDHETKKVVLEMPIYNGSAYQSHIDRLRTKYKSDYTLAEEQYKREIGCGWTPGTTTPEPFSFESRKTCNKHRTKRFGVASM